MSELFSIEITHEVSQHITFSILPNTVENKHQNSTFRKIAALLRIIPLINKPVQLIVEFADNLASAKKEGTTLHSTCIGCAFLNNHYKTEFGKVSIKNHPSGHFNPLIADCNGIKIANKSKSVLPARLHVRPDSRQRENDKELVSNCGIKPEKYYTRH